MVFLENLDINKLFSSVGNTFFKIFLAPFKFFIGLHWFIKLLLFIFFIWISFIIGRWVWDHKNDYNYVRSTRMK